MNVSRVVGKGVPLQPALDCATTTVSVVPSSSTRSMRTRPPLRLVTVTITTYSVPKSSCRRAASVGPFGHATSAASSASLRASTARGGENALRGCVDSQNPLGTGSPIPYGDGGAAAGWLDRHAAANTNATATTDLRMGL